MIVLFLDLSSHKSLVRLATVYSIALRELPSWRLESLGWCMTRHQLVEYFCDFKPSQYPRYLLFWTRETLLVIKSLVGKWNSLLINSWSLSTNGSKMLWYTRRSFTHCDEPEWDKKVWAQDTSAWFLKSISSPTRRWTVMSCPSESI